MGKWFKYIGLWIVVTVLSGPAATATELYTTDPGHYARPGEARHGARGSSLRRPGQARAGSHVIVRDDGALLERWIVNAGLSRACTNRLFRQKRDQYLVGVVDGRTYGAAVGGHGSLIDRAGMAENRAIYLFRGQGTTDCRVYHRTR